MSYMSLYLVEKVFSEVMYSLPRRPRVLLGLARILDVAGTLTVDLAGTLTVEYESRMTLVLRCILLASVGLTGCRSLDTQPGRFAFIDGFAEDYIERTTGCKEPTFTFVESKRVGTSWYDNYTFEGCGQKSDLITRITELQGFTTSGQTLAPKPEELRDAAKSQLTKTAEFDLDCKSGFEFSILSEVLDDTHTSLLATVGVRGCDKKGTYRTSCAATAFQNGKHEIKCTSVVTTTTE